MLVSPARVAAALLLMAAMPARGEESPAPGGAEAELDDALRLRLLAPLSGPRNSFFQSGFGIPELRPARVTAGEGSLVARLRSSMTHSADTRSVDQQRSRMDGLFIEHLHLDLELAVHPRVSLWTELRLGGWDERRDVFRIRDERGVLVIEGEADKVTLGRSTSRHENLTRMTGGVLWNIVRSGDGLTGLTASLAIKVPLSRQADISDSGTADLALTVHGSLALGDRVALHAQVGQVLPFGQPWIFEERGLFDAHGFFQGALGVSWAPTDWLSLGASVEGSTSPWDEEIEFLHRAAATGALGARVRLGRFTIELGGGRGLGPGGADWLGWVELGWAPEPLWEAPARP